MMLDPARLDEVFLGALSATALEARVDYLDQACGDDGELRERVEGLLAAHEAAANFLPTPNGEQTAPFVPLVERPGTVIGRYKLLEQIGEGGFGVVFMAEQEHPVRRRVALKVIKLGMDTKQVVARFEAERQALALMDHPNIAKVFDAGSTDTGRPYFVMELVRGVPITEYCDGARLSTNDRLALFQSVCSAVQHAHQKGIIHRDLKPSNVMVTLHDDQAVPKVIDFGVAKATQARLTERTLFTEFRQMIGTPTYMSPEQAHMSGLDVDTRSDVYSLGVMLYELLTGTTPIELKKVSSVTYDELRKLICEVDPPAPSARLSTLTHEELTTLARQRHCEPTQLAVRLRSDLDWIVMKCLEKDRKRRYESASAFAQDVQRFLDGEPVEARSPTRLYRLSKFIRRNKVGVITGTAIFSALVVGLALASYGLVHARRQAAIAKAENVRSEQVAKFLKEMLAAAGPSVARGRDATLLREILERTSVRVDKDLKDQPEIQGDLWVTLGKAFVDIGNERRAEPMFERAVDSYRLALGNENTKLARALGELGRCQTYGGNVASGMAAAQLGLDMARKCGDPDTLADCLGCMALSLLPSGQVASEGETYWREALNLRKQTQNDPVALADCMRGLAISLGSTDEAIPLSREAVAIYREHLGTDHPKYVKANLVLGQLLINRGRVAEAEAVLRETHELYRKLYDKSNPFQSIVRRFFAMTLVHLGKWDEAEALIREGMKVEAQSPANQSYHDDSNMLVRLKASRGQLQEALVESARLVDAYPLDDLLKFNRAILLLQSGQHEQYDRLCHEMLQRDGDELSNLRAARLALLLPVNHDDFERACQSTDAVASVKRPDSFESDIVIVLQLNKALADYRRGRYESAKDWAKRARVDDGKDPYFAAQALIIQTLACERLKQIEEARNTLNKCDELLAEPHVDFQAMFGGGGCGEWAIADVLRGEAAILLGIPRPRSSVHSIAPKGETPTSNNVTPVSTPTTKPDLLNHDH